MICSCPKCDAKTELDLSHIPEEGTSAKCPECKTRFWIAKESFARRALKKEGKTLCYYCNNELSNYLDCPTCGVMYPDFCVVQMSKPVRRKQRKTSAQISFSIRPQRRSRAVSQQEEPTEKTSKSILVTVGLLVLVAVLAVAIAIPYLNKKSEQKYATNFIRALYGIKLGTDSSIRQCATISAGAKAKISAGQNVLNISEEDKTKLDAAKKDVDTLMQRLPKTPKKFSKVNENLARLYGIYTKSYSLAAAPSGSLPGFTDSAGKLESEFRQAAQELKASMPTELAAEYQKALPKFKGLQDL
jgi:hypothetical protein